MDRDQVLITADPVGVKDLVLAPRSPTTILGASTALADWDTNVRARKIRGLEACEVIYAGGGQALLLAPRAQAAAIEDALRLGYASNVLMRDVPSHAEYVTASLAVSAQQLEGGRVPFGALVAALNLRLRQTKDSLQESRDPLPDRELRCQDCCVRAAAEGARHCARCASLRAVGSELLGRWGFRRDERSIADLSPDQLAYLAIDGTGMGGRLARARSRAEYRRLSQALLRAFDADQAQKIAQTQGIQRLLPVLRGGDDLILIFDARAGQGPFRFALALLEHIEATLAPHGEQLGAGAGLVISASLPAREAIRLAEALCREAKRGASEANARSGLDWEVVHGGDVISESVARGRASRVRAFRGAQGQPTALHRGCRPLALPEARRLLDAADSLGPTEPQLLQTLVDELDQDPLPALIMADYLISRQPRERAGELRALLEVDTPPWDLSRVGAQGRLIRRLPDHRFQTALPELVDLSNWRGGRA